LPPGLPFAPGVRVLPSSSGLQHLWSPTGTCPDDHYLIVIADDPFVVNLNAIFTIAIILWRARGQLCAPYRRYVHKEPITGRSDNAPVKSQSATENAKFQGSLTSLSGPRDFRTELYEILNEKRNQLDPEGPSTDLWDYKHARAHGGGRKRRRGPRLCRSTREVHEGGEDVAVAAVILIAATGGAAVRRLRYYGDAEPHLGVSRDFHEENQLVLAGTGGGAGNTAVLRGEPYQLAGSLRPPGGARMIYSVIEHPCRRGRNRTATPTVRNVRAAPPPPPPPRVEDVYAPATVSLSSRGPGTALFKNSPSERSSRRLEYLRIPDEKIDRPEAACLKIIAAMFRRGEVADEPPTSEHRHIFVHVKKLRLQRGLYPVSYTRHSTIFHRGTSDNIVNLASVKYQKRKRTVGVDGRPVMNNRALYEKVLARQERRPRSRPDWSNSKTFQLNSELLLSR
ncbi:hypothetical protein ALC56_09441, partial [Trachymyrmex septentrionalis]